MTRWRFHRAGKSVEEPYFFLLMRKFYIVKAAVCQQGGRARRIDKGPFRKYAG